MPSADIEKDMMGLRAQILGTSTEVWRFHIRSRDDSVKYMLMLGFVRQRQSLVQPQAPLQVLRLCGGDVQLQTTIR